MRAQRLHRPSSSPASRSADTSGGGPSRAPRYAADTLAYVQSATQAPIQRVREVSPDVDGNLSLARTRPRTTSLPSSLRAGVEQLSGFDMSDVRVHHDSPAPSQVRARAFTQGTDIHLGPKGMDHLPHEAWHVAQQKAGRVRATSQAGGVAINDSPSLEREAEDMGSKAARAGASRSGGERSAGEGSSSSAGPVQRFVTNSFESWPATDKWTDYDSSEGFTFRVSDDGLMAVAQPSYFGSKDCFATAGVMEAANKILNKQGAGAKFTPGDEEITVTDEGQQTHTLKRVVPTNRWKQSGKDISYMADCGYAAHEIMGSDEHGSTSAVYTKSETKRNWHGAVSRYVKDGGEKETTPRKYEDKYTYTGGDHNVLLNSPHGALREIFRDITDGTLKSAWKKYMKLSDTLRDNFDRVVGINKYAAPEIGESHVIVSNRDEYASGTKAAWIYHWGAVVLKSGGDIVTLENFATGTPGSNEDWMFQMYGPHTKAGQTFHEQQSSRTWYSEKHKKEIDDYGPNPTTLRMRFKR